MHLLGRFSASGLAKCFIRTHVRHSSDFEEVVKAFQEDATQELLRTTTGLKIHECKQATLKNGSLSIAVKVDIPNIKEAHMLRDNVLSGALDENCNKILSARKKITWEMAVERSHFLEYYERTLPGLWDLTAHQEEKLKELETADFHEVIHVKAPAGAGKTFVALRHILRCLQASRGQVLFVAPSALPDLAYSSVAFGTWPGAQMGSVRSVGKDCSDAPAL